jgi:phage-related protein
MAAHRELKPLEWMGSSKRDLMALPEPVVDVFGYALYLAQIGERHDQAKPWLRLGRRAGSRRRLARQCVPRRLYRPLCPARVCFARISEKVERGIETRKLDVDLIRDRLNAAATGAKEFENDRRS